VKAVAPKTNKQTDPYIVIAILLLHKKLGGTCTARMCGAGKTFRTARVAVYAGINWCPGTVEQKMRGT